jgi:methionyl-tRNA formyltransferase
VSFAPTSPTLLAVKPISIVFCATPTIAVPTLTALASDARFSVILVITQGDKPVGRKQVRTPPPIKRHAESLKIPVLQPTSGKHLSDSLQEIDRPDLLMTFAYGEIIPTHILSLPRTASLNIHPSLLPRWRGASPIQHAILNGDTETGISIIEMTEDLDAGPIVAQRTIPIDTRETTLSLTDTCATIAPDFVLDTLSLDIISHPQSEDGITVCKKLSRADGELDQNALTAQEIDQAVRAFTPWPGVVVQIDGTPLKILETQLISSDTSIPLPCKDASTLHILRVQPAGKTPMTAIEWQRGKRGS